MGFDYDTQSRECTPKAAGRWTVPTWPDQALAFEQGATVLATGQLGHRCHHL